MLRIRTILFILIFINISGITLASARYRFKRSQNKFILRKCTASAELNRKHKHEEMANENLKKISETSFYQPNTSLMIEEKNLDPTARNLIQAKDINSKLNGGHVHVRTIHNDSNIRRFTIEDTDNTPLKTVNIKAAQNIPPIFQRKSFLPELEDNIPHEKLNVPQNVIVIKPVI